MALLLIAISILPVVLLMIYIYKQDKYEKEPVKLLALTFLGGCFGVIILDLILVYLINAIWESETVFYSAFMEAGFPEELSKLTILYLIIWKNKNFNELMDGIVYATFVSLGFACTENIMYVFSNGFGTGVMRAIISVPGHFLFGVLMGYFFGLAKFSNEKTLLLLLSFLVPACAHGLFDWLLFALDHVSSFGMAVIITLFIAGDICLWIFGVRYIRKHRESSPFKNPQPYA